MKPQDLLLLAILIFFLWKNNKNWTVAAGLILIAVSIPLFARHIFFTAEHLVYFAALYILVAVIQTLFALRLHKS